MQKPAEAEHFRIETMASAKKFQTETEAAGSAEATRLQGQGEADAARLAWSGPGRGHPRPRLSEAEAMEKKAMPWQQYTQAAVIQILVEACPR